MFLRQKLSFVFSSSQTRTFHRFPQLELYGIRSVCFKFITYRVHVMFRHYVGSCRNTVLRPSPLIHDSLRAAHDCCIWARILLTAVVMRVMAKLPKVYFIQDGDYYRRQIVIGNLSPDRLRLSDLSLDLSLRRDTPGSWRRCRATNRGHTLLCDRVRRTRQKNNNLDATRVILRQTRNQTTVSRCGGRHIR